MKETQLGSRKLRWLPAGETQPVKIRDTFHDLVFAVNSLNISNPPWEDWKGTRLLDQVIQMQCHLLQTFCCWSEGVGFDLHLMLKYLKPEEMCKGYASSHLRELEEGRSYRKNYFGNSSDEEVTSGLKRRRL